MLANRDPALRLARISEAILQTRDGMYGDDDRLDALRDSTYQLDALLAGIIKQAENIPTVEHHRLIIQTLADRALFINHALMAVFSDDPIEELEERLDFGESVSEN